MGAQGWGVGRGSALIVVKTYLFGPRGGQTHLSIIRKTNKAQKRPILVIKPTIKSLFIYIKSAICRNQEVSILNISITVLYHHKPIMIYRCIDDIAPALL